MKPARGLARTLAVIGCVIALFVSPTTVVGQAASEPDLSGKWMGQCFGCAATGFTLVLTQKGSELTGTIQTTGTPNFGDSEKPILNGKVSRRNVIFQVKGDPGDLFDVELTASRDGSTLNGNGEYRGSFGLRFKRVSQ